MATQLNMHILLRSGFAADWERVNPILKQGEPGFVIDGNQLKIGDGVTPWNDLDSPSGSAKELADIIGTMPEGSSSTTLVDYVQESINNLHIENYVKTEQFNELKTTVEDLSTAVTELSEKVTLLEQVGITSGTIDHISVNGVILDIVNKTVDIPVASTERHGVVISSNAENKVSVAEDGTMEVNSINVFKLVKSPEDTIFLYAGTSDFASAR